MASLENSSRIWNYPKLKGVQNYQVWATKTKIVLINLGFWSLVSGTGSKASKYDITDDDTRNKEKAYTSLLLVLEDGPLEHVQQLTDASKN